MKYEVLLNSLLRLPMSKATKIFENYEKKIGFKNFAEQQRALDVLAHKTNTQRQIKKEVFDEALFCLAIMSRYKSSWSQSAFENIKNYPMIVWIECIGAMDSQSIMALLENYRNELTSALIETCIINLPEEIQSIALAEYKTMINPDGNTYRNFYYSVGDKARRKLKEYFPDRMGDDILLELQDLDEDNIVKRMSSEQERLLKLSSDDLVEFILLNATKPATLNRFFELFSDKVIECSIPKFELLFTRYRYLKNDFVKKQLIDGTRNFCWTDEDEKRLNLLTDDDLFTLFKVKFHEIGIQKTLALFDHNWNSFSANEFAVKVVLEFLDIAYADVRESKYINEPTILEIMKRFEKKCKSKEYSLEDLVVLVNNIGKGGKTKLISDDYIEAIIACGKLLATGVIDDENPLFVELRNKFSVDLLRRLERDGTYKENVSLNGVFYRLAKGSLSLARVYMTKTYRGLIYLTRCGEAVDDADHITTYLTDEQIAKLDISPVRRWNISPFKIDDESNDLLFMERMGLQLLCYFGRDRGKYLMEAGMQANFMENLFDGLNYAAIAIDENGNPKINRCLSEFLFGRGKLKESNSIINKMIRGELPEFKSWFTEFCNSFEKVNEACHGLLSVKRIVNYFESVEMPIELKPDEVKFKRALSEMNTLDTELLVEGLNLCKDARNRDYSSIPKVEGRMGDFVYKVLDLDDPLALAVGYLSDCCFVVRGISYSSLKHSMQSKNGRTFVVYYKGKFLTQSWIWRNGDVICFDSVEAGSQDHEVYRDEIKLVDVYKRAAEEMLYKSEQTEGELERVKVVTVGASDYILDGLEVVKGNTPRPLEGGVYVVDSSRQRILAGKMPDNPRYGPVEVRYRDKRKRVVTVDDIDKADIDTLDEVALKINSLRYQIHGEEMPIEFSLYAKIVLGDGWYILIGNDGTVENGVLKKDEETTTEYERYLSKYAGDSFEGEGSSVKKLLLVQATEDRR